jgi:hypothetical protein
MTVPIKNYTTKIDVFESLGEIQGALARNGARKIMVDYDDRGRPVGITFGLQTAPFLRPCLYILRRMAVAFSQKLNDLPAFYVQIERKKRYVRLVGAADKKDHPARKHILGISSHTMVQCVALVHKLLCAFSSPDAVCALLPVRPADAFPHGCKLFRVCLFPLCLLCALFSLLRLHQPVVACKKVIRHCAVPVRVVCCPRLCGKPPVIQPHVQRMPQRFFLRYGGMSAAVPHLPVQLPACGPFQIPPNLRQPSRLQPLYFLQLPAGL